MHATYPVVVRHHPGWFGAIVGLLLGIMLTLGGLLVMDRVDLTALLPTGSTIVQTPAQMYEAHFAREHRLDIEAARAAAIQGHFAREHRSDIAGR
jgi:hypothetical protein